MEHENEFYMYNIMGSPVTFSYANVIYAEQVTVFYFLVKIMLFGGNIFT